MRRDLDVPAESVAAVGEGLLPVQVPVPTIHRRSQLEAPAREPEGVRGRGHEGPAGAHRTGDASDHKLAGHVRASVVSQLDAGRAETDHRVHVGLEEVRPVDHVPAELRVDDRDRLGARLSLEHERAVVVGKSRVDLGERGTEGREVQVRDLELERRVVRVELVGPLEWVQCNGHVDSLAGCGGERPRHPARLSPVMPAPPQCRLSAG